MKINITIEIDKVISKPVTEWTKKDIKVLDIAKKKIVVIPKDEGHEPLTGNLQPLTHKIKKGETLSKIARKYGMSAGELSIHLMNTQGNSDLAPGVDIEIPRHYIDLSKA